jgi:hypothetical protein
VQRSQVIGCQAELILQLRSGCDLWGLALRAGSARQVVDPPVERIPVLTSKDHVLAADDKGRDGEPNALVHLVAGSRPVPEDNGVLNQPDAA